MFLVVLGHVLYTTQYNYSDRIIKAAISWIWFFHMPAFAIVSGYFFKTTKTTKQVLISARNVFSTYVVMQVLLSLCYGPTDVVTMLTIPQYALWYLLALPIWRIAAHLLYKMTKNVYFMILIGIIGCLLAGFVPTSILGFQRICSFFPFFCLGMKFNEKKIFDKLQEKRIFKIVSWIVLIALFVIFIIPNRAICSGMCNIPYNGLSQFFTRMSVLLIGTIMSVAFFSIIPENKKLASIGQKTLFIYCYHVFFILLIIPKIWIVIGVKPNILYIILYSALVFLLLGSYASRIKFLNYIIKPLEVLKNSKKQTS